MPKMKASVRRKYGSPNQVKIENIEKPIPKDYDALLSNK